MPAIRGVYYAHPQTGESGLWVVLLNGNVLGRTTAQIAAMVGTGNAATRMARLKAAAEAYLNAGLEERTPLATLDPDLPAKLATNPDPYLRIDGTDLVAQPSVATIEVLSLSPLRYQITISEGASRAEWRYG